MSSSLKVKDVSVVFATKKGPFHAIEKIDLDIAAGEFVCLVGHSGCGKSTLLNLFAGLNTPSTGELYCDGRLIVGPGPDRGVVFQQHSLLPWMTCFENVHLGVRRVFGAREDAVFHSIVESGQTRGVGERFRACSVRHGDHIDASARGERSACQVHDACNAGRAITQLARVIRSGPEMEVVTEITGV